MLLCSVFQRLDSEGYRADPSQDADEDYRRMKPACFDDKVWDPR